MPRQGKPTPRDSTRLKRDIARNDAGIRANARMMAEGVGPTARTLMTKESQRMMKEANAKQDTLTMMRKGVPHGTHHSFARDTEGFDGRALTTEGSPKPPRVSIPRGNPAPDVLPSATGTPALAQRASGLDPLRTDVVTKQAGDSRPQASSGRGTKAAVSRFNDRSV